MTIPISSKSRKSPEIRPLRLAVWLLLALFSASMTLAAFTAGKNGGSPWYQGRRAEKQPPKPDVQAVIGGEEVPNGTYPFIVAILDEDLLGNPPDPFFAQFCGGVMIAPQWVLTAAHCFFTFPQGGGQVRDPDSQFSVMVGKEDLSDSEGVIIPVERIITHEGFDGLLPDTVPNDIALIKLPEPLNVPFMPLNMDPDDPRAAVGENVVIAGWGARQFQAGRQPSEEFDFPVQLHQATVPIIDNPDCDASYGAVGVNILDSQVCAGFLGAGGVDSCAGDSGGPLFVNDQQGLLQVGLVSFGVDCADPAFPGVYTRISSFIDWINDNMADTIHFAQFGTGSGFTSDILLYNPNDLPADSEVNIWNEDGEPVEPSTVFAQIAARTAGGNGAAVVVPGKGSVVLATSGAGNLIVGSATVESDPPISGVIRFRLPGTGTAGVGTAKPAESVIGPVRRNANFNTGVAIRNTEIETVTVNLTLRNSQGIEVANGSEVLAIPARGRIARFIDELFEDADTSDFLGTISIETDDGRKVAVIAIELGVAAGDFTTLPVTVIR